MRWELRIPPLHPPAARLIPNLFCYAAKRYAEFETSGQILEIVYGPNRLD